MYKKLRFGLFFFLAIHSILAQSEFSTPDKIAIYWDTSLSMASKDITKEFELLDHYFTNLQNVEIELIKFNNELEDAAKFTINNGDWSLLKTTLLNTKYDGVAFFDLVSQNKKSDLNLLFTDGITTIDELEVSTKRPTYIVNSCEKANHRLLRKQGIRSQGNYINLNEVTIDQGLALLKVSVKNVPIKPGRANSTNLPGPENVITGTIYGPEDVLKDASIRLNNKSGALSDENGKFKIKAKDGDELMITHIGMQTQIIEVKRPYQIEVNLLARANPLQEVVVKGKSSEDEETEDTAHGRVDKRKLGYAVQSIDDTDISPAITDVSNAAQGKFSISNSGINNDLSRSVFRGFMSINFNNFPLIVIDNVPTRRTRNTTDTDENYLRSLVDPNNIEKITILKGLAATNSWGSEGKSGVVLITTKTATFGKKRSPNTITKRNNLYTENLTQIDTKINATYIDELKKFETLNEAYGAYLNQRSEYYDDPQYFINVADFILQWGNKAISSKILSNTIEIYNDDVNLLKLVAFKAEKNYDYLLAKKTYEKIVELRPKDAQSYRDLALIYQETGHYQEALNIYNDIRNNKIVGTDFSGIQKSIDSEFRRLVALHKEELPYDEIPKAFLNNQNYDARIVFEWNDIDAEFELQFVNPQKLFFNWSHTNAKDATRINNERIQGFNSEEFLLIDAPKGEWLININNKAKKKLKSPLLIKYTVFYNYGKANESKELKTVLLNNIKGKQMLGKIII